MLINRTNCSDHFQCGTKVLVVSPALSLERMFKFTVVPSMLHNQISAEGRLCLRYAWSILILYIITQLTRIYTIRVQFECHAM